MPVSQHRPDLARVAIDVGVSRQELATDMHPWTNRTAARHTDPDGGQWAVVVDWAHAQDGTRVPASVTLSSLGGSYADLTADVEPRAVTRAIVESVPWGSVLWGSRTSAARRARVTHQDGCRIPSTYQAPPPARSSRHDELLRQVADTYRRAGGRANPTVAKDVLARLESDGVRTGRGGPLTREVVRRWISEARERGYLPRTQKGRQEA